MNSLDAPSNTRKLPQAGRSADSRPQAGNGRSAPALGKDTKSAAAPAAVRRFRQRRYELMRVSGEVLGHSYRVAKCSKHLGKGEGGQIRDHVHVKRDIHGHAHWSGVSVCGSVWTCPVCSTKIQRSRRDEVKKALRTHRLNGGYALLANFTFSHSRFDKLSDLIPAFAKAQSLLKGSRAYKNIKADLGLIGTIKATELTHGDNGWHPHTHEIWFLSEKPTKAQIAQAETKLYEAWVKRCEAVGLGSPSRKHGVKLVYNEIEGSDAVGAYLAKWGDELTGSISKKATGGRSPWQILESLSQGWTPKDSALWKEYAEHTKGRAMLYWSPGLKDWFEIDEKTDQELADAEPPEVADQVQVTRAEFYAVCRARLQAQVLDVMEQFGPDACLEFVQQIHKADSDKRWQIEQEKRRLAADIAAQTRRRMREMGLAWR